MVAAIRNAPDDYVVCRAIPDKRRLQQDRLVVVLFDSVIDLGDVVVGDAVLEYVQGLVADGREGFQLVGGRSAAAQRRYAFQSLPSLACQMRRLVRTPATRASCACV